VADRREFVGFAGERKISRRSACRLVKVSRRRLKYQSVKPLKDTDISERLKQLAKRHPSYGVRMLTAKLKQAGMKINRKRVRRLCRLLGLLIRQKRRRKRRGIGAGVPCQARYPNHVWTYDFLEDRTEGGAKYGRKIRVLTIEDEFTRQCIEIETEHRMNAKYVGNVLRKCFANHGMPRFIRSDNGSEFIAGSLMEILAAYKVKPRHIDPGSPWQNGFGERFNGTYRSDCSEQNTFFNVDHARVICKSFKREYNGERPHSSLKYLTPDEFANQWRKENKANNEEKKNARTAAPAVVL
jgi:putative transposase